MFYPIKRVEFFIRQNFGLLFTALVFLAGLCLTCVGGYMFYVNTIIKQTFVLWPI